MGDQDNHKRIEELLQVRIPEIYLSNFLFVVALIGVATVACSMKAFPKFSR